MTNETTTSIIPATTLTLKSANGGCFASIPVPTPVEVRHTIDCPTCGSEGTVFSIMARPTLEKMSLEEGIATKDGMCFVTATGCTACIAEGNTMLSNVAAVAASEFSLMRYGMMYPGIRLSKVVPGTAWAPLDVVESPTR